MPGILVIAVDRLLSGLESVEALTSARLVYVCGDAYSMNQGWAEGALQTAELVLDRMGRRAQALDVYQELRARLRDDLGIEPGTLGLVLGDGTIDVVASGHDPRGPEDGPLRDRVAAIIAKVLKDPAPIPEAPFVLLNVLSFAALCALAAVQASLLFGYANWGGIKEACTAALLVTLAWLAAKMRDFVANAQKKPFSFLKN